MDKELKEFNQILKKYVGEFRKADEKLFNYGVELGRILEKNNIKEHRPNFFVEQEEAVNQIASKQSRIHSVNKIITKMIGLAHKEQVKTCGSSYYDTGYGADNHPLNKDIENKYNITYSRINQERVDADFDVQFIFNGKLKDIFEMHKVDIEVELMLSNSSGEKDECITREDDAESCFYDAHISLYAHDETKGIAEVDAFATDVEKFFTMFCLKLT